MNKNQNRSTNQKEPTPDLSPIPLFYLEDAAWGQWPHFPHTFSKTVRLPMQGAVTKKTKE